VEPSKGIKLSLCVAFSEDIGFPKQSSTNYYKLSEKFEKC